MNYTLGRILLIFTLSGLFLILGIHLAFTTGTGAETSVVRVLGLAQDSGGGTGFTVESKGKNYIVTNSHVCAVGAEGYVIIEQDNGKKSLKRIIADSPRRDLCLIEGAGAKPLNLSSTPLKRFEKLLVIGHPLLKPTAHSEGEYTGDTIVTIPRPVLDAAACKEGEFVETMFFGNYCLIMMELSFSTVAIYPGNSGSPVLNQAGEVVGVINSAYTDDRGLFVPLVYLREMLEATN